MNRAMFLKTLTAWVRPNRMELVNVILSSNYQIRKGKEGNASPGCNHSPVGKRGVSEIENS